MSRKIVVKVEDYARLRPGQVCRLIVFHIEKKGRARCMEAELKNLEPEHDGRIHKVVLPLPVRPAGRSAEFFRAIGQEVAVSRSLALRDAVGKTLKGTFGSSADGELEIVSFHAFLKESEHVTRTE